LTKEIYILSASRTPVGAYGGALASVPATVLSAESIKSALEKAKVSAEKVESIVLGNVLSANIGQAPARQASMAAGLPISVCATTVNKVCASGMKAISMISNDILLGNIELGIAGGMESMSQVPHYVPNARFGIGYGNATLQDGIAKDGLTDVYSKTTMGVSGDKTAEKYEINREAQDDFAERSFKKAAESWANGVFAEEICTISIPQKKGNPIVVTEDEGFRKANFEKMRTLKPVFSADGTVTAANASPLNDGASALILASGAFVNNNNLKPLAKIVAYAEAEGEPTFFTTTPVLATEKVLKKANLTLADIDFFEVNEAFAVVPLAFSKLLNVPQDKINVRGGAVALGHALGSSGSRIVVSLVHILKAKNAKYGLATVCNGGGGASAIIIENIS
jgi:acetyl-CoA C-acetyltransferase